MSPTGHGGSGLAQMILTRYEQGTKLVIGVMNMGSAVLNCSAEFLDPRWVVLAPPPCFMVLVTATVAGRAAGEKKRKGRR